MSIESYILGLQKNPSPGIMGKIVLSGLKFFAAIYEKGVIKKYKKTELKCFAKRIIIHLFSPAVIKAD